MKNFVYKQSSSHDVTGIFLVIELGTQFQSAYVRSEYVSHILKCVTLIITLKQSMEMVL